MPLNSIMEHTYSQINFFPVDLPYHSTAVVASDSTAVFTPIAMPPQPIHRADDSDWDVSGLLHVFYKVPYQSAPNIPLILVLVHDKERWCYHRPNLEMSVSQRPLSPRWCLASQEQYHQIENSLTHVSHVPFVEAERELIQIVMISLEIYFLKLLLYEYVLFFHISCKVLILYSSLGRLILKTNFTYTFRLSEVPTTCVKVNVSISLLNTLCTYSGAIWPFGWPFTS